MAHNCGECDECNAYRESLEQALDLCHAAIAKKLERIDKLEKTGALQLERRLRRIYDAITGFLTSEDSDGLPGDVILFLDELRKAAQ